MNCHTVTQCQVVRVGICACIQLCGDPHRLCEKRQQYFVLHLLLVCHHQRSQCHVIDPFHHCFLAVSSKVVCSHICMCSLQENTSLSNHSTTYNIRLQRSQNINSNQSRCLAGNLECKLLANLVFSCHWSNLIPR